MAKNWGHITPDEKSIELDFFLIVDCGDQAKWAHLRRPSARVTAGAPSLARTERAINLKVSLPMALFETPSISASIAVEAPDRPVHIDIAEVAKAVRSVIGMDVAISVQQPGETE